MLRRCVAATVSFQKNREAQRCVVVCVVIHHCWWVLGAETAWFMRDDYSQQNFMGCDRGIFPGSFDGRINADQWFCGGFFHCHLRLSEGIQWDSLIFRIDTCQRCFNDFDVPIFEKSRPCSQCCRAYFQRSQIWDGAFPDFPVGWFQGFNPTDGHGNHRGIWSLLLVYYCTIEQYIYIYPWCPLIYCGMIIIHDPWSNDREFWLSAFCIFCINGTGWWRLDVDAVEGCPINWKNWRLDHWEHLSMDWFSRENRKTGNQSYFPINYGVFL